MRKLIILKGITYLFPCLCFTSICIKRPRETSFILIYFTFVTIYFEKVFRFILIDIIAVQKETGGGKFSIKSLLFLSRYHYYYNKNIQNHITLIFFSKRQRHLSIIIIFYLCVNFCTLSGFNMYAMHVFCLKTVKPLFIWINE